MAIPHIITECTGDHHQAILAALADGKSPEAAAKEVGMSISTVRRTARVAKHSVDFDLFVVNDGMKCPVAKITTSQGFEHACTFALKKWGGSSTTSFLRIGNSLPGNIGQKLLTW